MKKKTSDKINGFFIAFLLVATVFLAVGLGTLGSFHSLGDAYLLTSRQSGDNEPPNVEFELTNPKDEDGKAVTLKVVEAYINVSVIYAEEGVPAQITLERRSSSSSSSSWSSAITAKLENFYTPETGADGKPLTTTGKDVFYRFVMPFTSTSNAYGTAFSSGGYTVSTYPFYRLTASGGVNLLINEFVFVGVRTSVTTSELDASTERFIVPARVSSATPFLEESAEEARLRACALTDDASVNYTEAEFAAIDAWNDKHPSTSSTDETGPVLAPRRMADLKEFFPASQSSYSQFTKEEIASLVTIAEMKQGATYHLNGEGEPGTYYADRVYGAFGTDFLALGTLIFGTSPFGLRFFPMLAMFGVLVVLSRFVTRLARSEKAGLVFSVLFALSCLTLGIGHTGTPFAIGLFFFACALDLVHRFYANGVKKAGFFSVLPMLGAGLCLAASICVQGAFVIPAVGVVVLFVLGVVRLHRAKKYAIARIEAQPETIPEENSDEVPETKEAQIAAQKAGYRFRTAASSALFAAGIVVGALLFALVGMIPAYYAYQKVYDNLAQPTMNVFLLAWQTFANGFTGVNPYVSGGGWDFLRTVFVGAPVAGNYLPGGENVPSFSYFARTVYTVNWVAALAVLVALAVAVVLVVSALRKKDAKAIRISLRRLLIPLCAAALALVAAAVSPSAFGFITLAWVMGFALAAPVFAQPHEGKAKIAARTVNIAGLVLLAAVFGLLAVFTFSVPVSAQFLTTIFG